MSEAEVCASCRFWTEETHLCRRHAPLPIADSRESGGDSKAVWLATDGEDWCGEYEPVLIEEEYDEEAEEEEFEDDEWADDGSPAW